jgi:hypothetical protein
MRLRCVIPCCGLLALGCAGPARPQPVPPSDPGVPTEPVAPRDAGDPVTLDAAPDISDASADRLEVEAAIPADAGPGDAAAEEARAPSKRARFRCFGWVHGPQSSTDCFRTQWECDHERLKMKAGSRDVLPACKATDGAWCTKVGRNLIKKSQERCFGSAYYCDQYVRYVRGNGLVTTDCAER